MRAIEIFEQADTIEQMDTLKNPKLVERDADNSYYELDAADWQRYKKWALSHPSGESAIRFENVPDSGLRYFIRVREREIDPLDLGYEWPRWSYEITSYVLQGDNIYCVIHGTGLVYRVGGFKKFLKFTGAKRSYWNPDYQKNLVIRDGKVITRKDAKETLRFDSLDGMPVYKGTLQDVDIFYGIDPSLTKINADTIYQIHNPVLGLVDIRVKNGKIVNKPWNLDKLAMSLKLLKDFSNKYKIDLPDEVPMVVKSEKPRWVKPGSNFHKMLKYVSENPGATRSDWFVKYLGNDPQGMPGWSSNNAWDGLAASKGLIQNNTNKPNTYRLEITTPGEMVLSVLDAGQKVDLNAMDDES